jgi:adenine-specific DNA methylase
MMGTTMNAPVKLPPVTPFLLKDAPSLIERVWPAQKISVETKREFDAHGAQTLTALGSYWKGRKRLVYVRACVLGALLPATDDPEKDLAIFEKLMAIDDRAFLHRENKLKPHQIVEMAIAAGAISSDSIPLILRPRRGSSSTEETMAAYKASLAVFDGDRALTERVRLAAYATLSYDKKVALSLRPEELPDAAYDAIWPEVNAHLGTSASSHVELVEQLGIMRFGRRPKAGDVFSGSGQIPFEAARMGCDVYASDLNPLACMLTWGALHLVGGPRELHPRLAEARKRVAAHVEREIARIGVERNDHGDRAKAYLYCVEVTCPITGYKVPVMPSLIISKIKRTIGRLVPNHESKRIDIEIISDVEPAEMEAAKLGTYQGGAVVYEMNGETYRTPFDAIRGDFRRADGSSGNALRMWEKDDVIPRPDDILGERLYAIQWMKAGTETTGRPTLFFAAPTPSDLKRETIVVGEVRTNLPDWQSKGLVPDMVIERGVKTDEPIRTRGWTHWHHLFVPRQLLIGALIADGIAQIDDAKLAACLQFDRTFVANFSSKLSQWLPGSPGIPGRAAAADQVKGTFYNQALNTFLNFGCRAYSMIGRGEEADYKHYELKTDSEIVSRTASEIAQQCDLWITDPPYADAVNYHEITEFFIAWLRRNPPAPFQDWVWDSRRPLAIKGDGEDFRDAMVRAYRALTDHMPDNGLQIVMFTHQDAGVWADMAQIFWGAGLQVTGAWYVTTEAMSDTKKGGYVQGTVTLVLRKRPSDERGYRDEIVQEVKAEVAHQIDTMVGLNQTLRGHGRVENLFEDADLQMAGYAAALRVLTRYAVIDGVDMTKEALRSRKKGERGVVGEIIEFAVQVANEHLVPEGLEPRLWDKLNGAERFFMRMLDVETSGAKKLDNYQNFAKAFRVGRDWQRDLMGSLKPNEARLKSAVEFRKSIFDGDFGTSRTRAVLYALHEIQAEVDGDLVLSHLRELVPTYLADRDDLGAIAAYIALKKSGVDAAEASAARVLQGLLRNERLG